MNILGAIAFVLSGLSCYSSIMLRFGENNTPDMEAFYVIFLILGLVFGLMIAFVVIIPMGKKCFPDNKPKGFLENLPGVFMGFIIAFCVVALVFQGYYLVIS